MSALASKADISRGPQMSAALGARCTIRLLPPINEALLNKQGQRHGQGSSGRVQRWCDCDYHHDYGAGVKGAARLGLDALMAVTPNFVSYGLSFVYLAIYWNNHHHLLH